MDRQEQNWQNFCNNHVADWYGLRTIYLANGDVIESAPSLRSFRTNEEKTLTFQKNYYNYSLENVEEKIWNSTKESRNKQDGLIHPRHPWMRSLYFEQGAALWVTKEPQFDMTSHKTELFFKENHLRFSIGTVYGKDDKLQRLQRLWIFKEDSRGFPSQYWSSETDLLKDRLFKDNWIGKSIKMNPDLEVFPSEVTELNWTCKDHKLFFLPDGISLSCPEIIETGSPFKIIANWFIKSSYLQQLVVNYDENLAFSGASLEFYD